LWVEEDERGEMSILHTLGVHGSQSKQEDFIALEERLHSGKKKGTTGNHRGGSPRIVNNKNEKEKKGQYEGVKNFLSYTCRAKGSLYRRRRRKGRFGYSLR